jgi:hypothetical protein
VNYTGPQSGLASRYPDHPGRNRQPFFFTPPRQRNNRVVLPFQQQFVDKLLSHTLKRGHVLYCIDNETSGEPAWSAYWARWIRKRAEEAGKRVCITEMWDDWNLRGPHHRRTLDHPERYDFIDVSQNNHQKGQTHWDHFQWVRSYLAKQPRPINTVKTYGADGNKFGHTSQDGIERFWRHLIGGAASARFHRPPAGLGLSAPAIASIRAARKLQTWIQPWEVEPANDLLGSREQNEAYAAARPGQAYVVYFPTHGIVELKLVPAKQGQYTLYWLDVATGKEKPGQEISATDTLHLKTPGQGGWVAAVVAGQ